MSPLVTLTTDFGTRDSYVAEMKGVLFSRGPVDLRVVDLSHEIGARDVRAGALLLRAAVPRFPRGTIHLAVIDPGVGSTRRAIAIELGGQFLVGPDNGLFGLLYDGTELAVELDLAHIGVDSRALSATFHGRDLFAPAAAALAQGRMLSDLGSPVTSLVTLALPAATERNGALHGEVIAVDHYGNLITSVCASDLSGLRAAEPTAGFHAAMGERTGIPVKTHYAEVARGELLALVGSSGRFEIALRDGSAATLTGAGIGTAVIVSRGA